jgi:hypothetical protein
MSDNTTDPQNQEPGQAGGKEGQQFLTVAEYEAGQKQLLEEVKKSNSGLAGSMGETQGKRIAHDVRGIIQAELKQLGRVLEASKAAGNEISPELENSMKQQIINDALTNEPEEIPASQDLAPPQAPAQAPEEPQDPITAAAWKEMKERGVEIFEEDPEYELLDMATPYKFLLSVDKAISAKETRLQETPPEEKPGSPNVRIPGVGAGGESGTLLPQGTPAIDRLDAHYKKQGI